MDKELLDASAEFLRYFELVFDNDWSHTKFMVREREHFIKGTFVNPDVEDEENDWSNRARILEAYRHLKALLKTRGGMKRSGHVSRGLGHLPRRPIGY